MGCMQQLNVLGTELQACSHDPVTGFYRTGCCENRGDDPGMHVVCCRVTAEFLAFSADRGNDLVTPMPDYGFPGCSPVTSGACAPPAGPRRWRPELRAPSCSKRPISRHSSSSTSTISVRTPSPDSASRAAGYDAWPTRSGQRARLAL